MSERIKEIIVRYDDKQSFIYGNTLGEVIGELVRCKECKWHSYDTDDECRWRIEEIPKDDDFCSRGERKESE